MLILCACLVLAGCAKGRLGIHPVRGQAFFKDKPLVNATIMFHPLGDKEELKGIMPHGRVDQDGNFTLTTYGMNDGAPAGDYAVTIEWPVPRPKVEDPEEALAGGDYFKGRYAQAQTSGLRAQVTAGVNEPVFRLPVKKAP